MDFIMAQTKSLLSSDDDININLIYGIPEDNKSLVRILANPCSSDKESSQKCKRKRGRPRISKKIVECCNCKKNFTENTRLKSKSSKSEGTKQYCDQCLQKKNVYQCNLCHKSYGFKSCLTIHSRLHSNLRPYKCELCGRSFTRQRNLRCHYQTHREKPYYCKICGKMFTQKSLKIRLKSESSVAGDTKQYCDKCLQKKNAYQCNLCNKSFCFKSWLTIHSRSHSKARPYKCELCNRSFARKQTLGCHYRTHTGEKPYYCEICGKNFTQKGNLMMHNRKHLNEKLCKCCMCKKTFVHQFKINQGFNLKADQYCDLCKESRDIFKKLSRPLDIFIRKSIFLNLSASL